MSKVSARWVPGLLTPDQKLTRLVMSEANLAKFEADLDRFVERFLTQDECQDECWVHHFEPETKRQSMQWKHSTSPAPKKTELQNLSSTTFEVRNYLSSIRLPKKNIAVSIKKA